MKYIKKMLYHIKRFLNNSTYRNETKTKELKTNIHKLISIINYYKNINSDILI